MKTINSFFVVNAMVGLLIFRITFDVAMAVDLMIHEGAFWRTSLSFQLPLADCLPSVLNVIVPMSKLRTICRIIRTWLFFSTFYTMTLLCGKNEATMARD
jgi:hypothetical protein